MDGETYEQWVAGVDVDTGRKKGRVRDDANALRFVEVTVNGPKTWSLAAALNPDISIRPPDKPRTRPLPEEWWRPPERVCVCARPPGSGRVGGRCRCRSRRSRQP